MLKNWGKHTMGYFSNGTEGECYMQSYCFKCKNWREKKGEGAPGCPIMDLHMFHGYDLCNSRSLAKKMLDFLIPIDKKVDRQ